jgi:hypothetical protein
MAKRSGSSGLLHRRIVTERLGRAVTTVKTLARVPDLGPTRQIVLSHLLSLAGGIMMSENLTFVPVENLELIAGAIEQWLSDPLLAEVLPPELPAEGSGKA